MAATVDKSKCTGCNACASVCPVSAISIENGKAVINDDCVECGACISECPNEALSL
jgi:ferredoxin